MKLNLFTTKGINNGGVCITRRGYESIQKELIATDTKGQLVLKNTCHSGGVGNNPYRDGSYRYYLSEPIVTNDAHGAGSFLLTANEMNEMEKVLNLDSRD